MVETHVAIRGVVSAILDLHSEGTFTDILDSLFDIVNLRSAALDSAFREEDPSPHFDVGPDLLPVPRPPKRGSYVENRRKSQLKHAAHEDGLREWAGRFHLTNDLSENGERLTWAIDFARALCAGKHYDPPEPSRGQGPPPMGPWYRLTPNPTKESRSDWERRIRPTLRQWYEAERKRQRSKSYPNPAKRKPDHYRWFVLYVCARYSYNGIAELLGIPVQPDAVRKGVGSICLALDLKRK
jgi:hypothetical protein